MIDQAYELGRANDLIVALRRDMEALQDEVAAMRREIDDLRLEQLRTAQQVGFLRGRVNYVEMGAS